MIFVYSRERYCRELRQALAWMLSQGDVLNTKWLSELRSSLDEQN